MTDHAHNFRDITDQVFGEVRVIEFSHRNKNGEAMWTCLCLRCGREFIASGHHLRRDKVHYCNNCRLAMQPLRARVTLSARRLKAKLRKK